MNNKKNEIKLFFNDFENKLELNHEEIKLKISKFVFVDQQKTVVTQYEEKLKLFKGFISICEQICYENNNPVLQNKIKNIATEKIILASKFTQWYVENIVTLNKAPLLDGVIVQMVNKFLSPLESKINILLQELLKDQR